MILIIQQELVEKIENELYTTPETILCGREKNHLLAENKYRC